MPILALMGKRREELLAAGALPDPERTGLFTTATVSITGEGPIALFATGRKHAGENLTKLLAQRDAAASPPIHMCDGLDRNRPNGHTVLEANCLAHGRRQIVDEIANFPTECRYVLETLGKVFKHDEDCRQQGRARALDPGRVRRPPHRAQLWLRTSAAVSAEALGSADPVSPRRRRPA